MTPTTSSRPRRKADSPIRDWVVIGTSLAMCAAIGAGLGAAALAHAAPTPDEVPYAAVYASNTRGDCSLDVYGWTAVDTNLYINNRRSNFLPAGGEGFAFRLAAENGVVDVNQLEVRQRDTVVLASYKMTANCTDAPTPTPSVTGTPRPPTPTPTTTATATRSQTATPRPSTGTTPPAEAEGGLASTGYSR